MARLCDGTVEAPAMQRDNALASKWEYPAFALPPSKPARFMLWNNAQSQRETTRTKANEGKQRKAKKSGTNGYTNPLHYAANFRGEAKWDRQKSQK